MGVGFPWTNLDLVTSLKEEVGVTQTRNGSTYLYYYYVLFSSCAITCPHTNGLIGPCLRILDYKTRLVLKILTYVSSIFWCLAKWWFKMSPIDANVNTCLHGYNNCINIYWQA